MFSIIYTEKFCDCLSCWIGLEYVVLRKYTLFKAFGLLQLQSIKTNTVETVEAGTD
jgi:hypothetical protein